MVNNGIVGRHRAVRSARRLRARIIRVVAASALAASFLTLPSHAVADTVPLLPAGKASSLNDAFHTNSPVFLAGTSLCRTTTTVQSTTSSLPGVSSLMDYTSAIVCAAQTLGYAYRTTYTPPGGGTPVVRYYRALVGVPAPLNVTGVDPVTGLPDSLATPAGPNFVALLSPNPTPSAAGLQMSISRTALADSAKVKIEAFFVVPTAPAMYVYMGEDGSEAGTAKSWRTFIGANLISLANRTLDLTQGIYSRYPSSALSLVGGALFPQPQNGSCSPCADADPDHPAVHDDASMRFSPVPINYSTRAVLSPGQQEIHLSHDCPDVSGQCTSYPRLTTTVQLVDPDGKSLLSNRSVPLRKFSADVNVLPQRVDVVHRAARTTSGDTEQTVTYSVPQPLIPLVPANVDVSGDYLEYDNQVITNAHVVAAGHAKIASLPDNITVRNYQKGAKTDITTTVGSAIGSVEASFALGTDNDVPSPYPLVTSTGTSPAPAAPNPFAGFRLYSMGSDGIPVFDAAVRIPSIHKASVDLTGPYVAGLEFGTAPGYFPLSATDAVDSLKVYGHISNLPKKMDVTADLDNKHITYTGTDALGLPRAIDEIEVVADKTDGTALIPNLPPSLSTNTNRSRHADLKLNGIPGSLTVDYNMDSSGLVISPSSPVTVSALISDGSGAPVPTAPDYASYEDTPSVWRAFAQVSNIVGFGFHAPTKANPATNTPADPQLRGSIEFSQPQQMDVYAHVSDGQAGHDATVNASIKDVPARIDFSFDTAKQLSDNRGPGMVVDFNSNNKPINQITVSANGLYNIIDPSQALPFNVSKAYVEIDKMPNRITVEVPNNMTADNPAVFDPHGSRIGRVLAQLAPSNQAFHSSVANPTADTARLANGDLITPNVNRQDPNDPYKTVDQTAYANLQTGQFTVDIHNIGRTTFGSADGQTSVAWDIARTPLDATFVSDDGKFAKARLSNPQPGNVYIDTRNGVFAHYQAANTIDYLDVQTNMLGTWVHETVQDIAPTINICFQSGPACYPMSGTLYREEDPSNPRSYGWMPDWKDKPAWGNHDEGDPLFSFYFRPITSSGTPATMQLDGVICTSQIDKASCESGGSNSRIAQTGFLFSTVEAGAGYKDLGCDIYCSTAYVYFNTNGDLQGQGNPASLRGNVSYYDGSDKRIEFTSDQQSGFGADHLRAFLHIDVADLHFGLLHTGDLVCDPSAHINVYNSFDDFDVLRFSDSFTLAPGGLNLC